MNAEILPLKTAAEVWAQSGSDMWVYRTLPIDGLMHLQGKGERCAMTDAEYWSYERMKGGGPVSMLVADAEAERQWDNEAIRPAEVTPAGEDLQRIYTALETVLTEVTALVSVAQQTLSVDDYGDNLAGALRRLELCVRCVWSLQGFGDSRTITPSNHEIVRQLEELQAENARLRELLDRKAGCIISDLSAKLEAETKKMLSSRPACEPVCDDCGLPATCTGYHELAGYVHSCDEHAVSMTQNRPLAKTGGTDAA